MTWKGCLSKARDIASSWVVEHCIAVGKTMLLESRGPGQPKKQCWECFTPSSGDFILSHLRLWCIKKIWRVLCQTSCHLADWNQRAYLKPCLSAGKGPESIVNESLQWVAANPYILKLGVGEAGLPLVGQPWVHPSGHSNHRLCSSWPPLGSQIPVCRQLPTPASSSPCSKSPSLGEDYNRQQLFKAFQTWA